jgi:hypothetical protein
MSAGARQIRSYTIASKAPLEARGRKRGRTAIDRGGVGRRGPPALPELRHPRLTGEKLGDEGRERPRPGAWRKGALIRKRHKGPRRMALFRLIGSIHVHDA